MINDLNLFFDDQALLTDLTNTLVQAIQMVSEELMKYMQSSADSKISSHFVNYVVYDAGANMISSVVGNDHWIAFLDNYGTGSEMSKQNPWLNEYIQSEYFNKDRLDNGMAIMARDGEYTTPDYKSGSGKVTKIGSNMRDSEGNLVNLEKTINPNTGTPYAVPRHAKLWLENGMQYINKRFIDTINKALDNFNFNKYLSGGI